MILFQLQELADVKQREQKIVIQVQQFFPKL